MKVIYVLLCAFFLFACEMGKKSSNEVVVQMEEQSEPGIQPFPIQIVKSKNQVKTVDIHDVADVCYLKMETQDASLFPSKWRFSGLYMTDDDLFLSFGDNILRFDKNGNFLNTIGRKGGAPFEFANGGTFCVNESLKEVYLLDFAKQRTLVYEYGGKYKRSFRNEVYFDRFYVLNDTSFICSNNDINQEDRIFTLSLKDGKKGNVLLGKKPDKDLRGLMVNIGAFARLNAYKEQVYFCISTSDTIFAYDIKQQKLYPAYVQSPLNGNNDEIKTVPYLQFETSQFSSILINDKPMPNFTYWFDKGKKEIFKVRIWNRDLDGYVLMWGCNRDNITFDILEMGRLKEKQADNKLSGELKMLVENSDVEDNPILMIARMK